MVFLLQKQMLAYKWQPLCLYVRKKSKTKLLNSLYFVVHKVSNKAGFIEMLLLFKTWRPKGSNGTDTEKVSVKVYSLKTAI